MKQTTAVLILQQSLRYKKPKTMFQSDEFLYSMVVNFLKNGNEKEKLAIGWFFGSKLFPIVNNHNFV